MTVGIHTAKKAPLSGIASINIQGPAIPERVITRTGIPGTRITGTRITGTRITVTLIMGMLITVTLIMGKLTTVALIMGMLITVRGTLLSGTITSESSRANPTQ